MAKTRELTDIHLNEVSIVDKAANKKKFLFFKQDGKKLKKKLSIVIESDGTKTGTKIDVNGSPIKKMTSFNFSFWGDIHGDGSPISCSYSRFVEADDGFERSETFFLAKGNFKMKKEIKEALEKYFGDEVKVEDFAHDTEITKEALDTILDYQADFPSDLKEAVGVLAKNASCPIEIEKKVEVEVEKIGAKLSKDVIKKITDALATLKSILPQLAEKSDAASKDDLTKTLEELNKAVKGLETKDDENRDEKILKSLQELAARIETVEKHKGKKQSVEGQDDNDDNKGINKNDDGIKWPSFA